MTWKVTRSRTAEGGKRFHDSLGDSARGVILTIFKKKERKNKRMVLRMVKRDLDPFLVSKSPHAMFSIKKSPEQIEDTVSGSKKGRWIPWPSQRMVNSTRQLNAGDLCVGSGNEDVSVVGGAWAFGSFSVVSISLLRFFTCPLTISLNYLNICGSWFLLTIFVFSYPLVGFLLPPL